MTTIEVVSASTLNSTLAKDGLVRWKENITADGVLDNLDTISRMSRIDAKAFIRELPWRGTEGRLGAAQAGTDLHAVFEAWMLGNDPYMELHPSLRGMAQQLGEWISRFQPKLIDAERVVFNPVTRIGGRFDQKVELILPQYGDEPKTWLVDLKTSYDDKFKSGGLKKPYADSVALQLATYGYATHQATIDVPVTERWDGRLYQITEDVLTTSVEPVPVDLFGVIYLTPERCWLYPIEITEAMYDTATHAANVWRWTNEGSKKILEAPIK